MPSTKHLIIRPNLSDPHSAGLRPKIEPGKFHVGILGQNFDPAELTDPAKFIKFFNENVRNDIVFKSLTQLTYWKSVHGHYSDVVGNSSRVTNRPKMRMVDKFREGRVFIAGGTSSAYVCDGDSIDVDEPQMRHISIHPQAAKA